MFYLPDVLELPNVGLNLVHRFISNKASGTFNSFCSNNSNRFFGCSLSCQSFYSYAVSWADDINYSTKTAIKSMTFLYCVGLTTFFLLMESFCEHHDIIFYAK